MMRTGGLSPLLLDADLSTIALDWLSPKRLVKLSDEISINTISFILPAWTDPEHEVSLDLGVHQYNEIIY